MLADHAGHVDRPRGTVVRAEHSRWLCSAVKQAEHLGRSSNAVTRACHAGHTGRFGGAASRAEQ